jgi:hypothetical protein
MGILLGPCERPFRPPPCDQANRRSRRPGHQRDGDSQLQDNGASGRMGLVRLACWMVFNIHSQCPRDWGTSRGYPNQSEYTVVKVDFYNNIQEYLVELKNTTLRSLEDLVAFNHAHNTIEGGTPGAHPAFASGQDSFLVSLESKGVKDDAYWQALDYIRRITREEGIDA